MELSFAELKDLMTISSEAGAKKAMIELGHISPTISKAQAYRMYGKGTVDRWIRESLIKPEKDGTNSSKMRIDRLEIDRISKASNRASWFNQLIDDDVFDPKIIPSKKLSA